MAARRSFVGTKIADRYIITGEIGAGGMGRVFRAMPFDDPSQDVAIKVILRNQTLDSEDLLRFQKEASLMSRLHHPNIICFHELGLLGDNKDGVTSGIGAGYYIVMEIASGRNLKESLAMDSRKDLAFFFEVGLQVTAALDYTHGKNIIHRDIKPQNIVVGSSWQEQRGVLVKVLDFGVARLAEVIGQSGDQYMDVAGTPMYMAPEQTPLLNAPIDHRVDLYSLGCVLYEILAGRPPFTAKTRDNLMRQHVNVNPEPLTAIRPDIPPMIGEIVHKLLAKHPDDRYQTAFGLHADLQRAKAKFQSRGRKLMEFPLGLNDGFRAVSANLDLVGRDRDYQALIDHYQAIANDKSRSRLTVITGPSGVGKTRLLTEFRSYLTRRKIRFISTSFSRHENNLPFNALANGFNEYLIRVLKSQPHEAEEVRRKVRTLLGPMAYRVAQVVPGLKPYIDPELEEEKKTEIPDEDSDVNDFQTFAKAFSDFTRCLAPNNDPVVFIFDDMHWADEKSVQLIDQFFSHNNSQRFFMVIGYRPLDSSETKESARFLEKFSKMRRRFTEMELGPFDHGATAALTAKMLNAPASVTPELALFLWERTAGNPMYLVELVRALVAQEVVNYNPKSGKWEYRIEEIREARIRLDSVDLTLSRLQNYEHADREVLEIASVVGMIFQFELLLIEPGMDAVRAMNALEKAINEGLITRAPEDAELKVMGKAYAFTHRRVREAILDTIERGRKNELHRRVALHLEKSVQQPGPKTVFTIAHHINQIIRDGSGIGESLAEKGVVPNINAGRVAAAAGSWQSAQHYFENAHLLLKYLPESENKLKTLAFVLENLADISARQGRSSAAIALYEKVLHMPLPKETFAKVASKAHMLKIVGGQLSLATSEIQKSLKRFGIRWPTVSWWNRVRLIAGILRDGGPDFFASKVRRLLRRLSLSGKDVARSVGFVGTADLLRLAQSIKLRESPEEALYIHALALKLCCEGDASIDTILKSVVDRAHLLGHLGFDRQSYRLFDLASDLAHSYQRDHTLGLILLRRALSVDSYRAREEEIERNLDSALELIGRDDDRLSYATAVFARMSKAIFKGHMERVESDARLIPYLVSTRNWLSPRGMMVYLFKMFLEDARDSLVRQGESYLKRRTEVGGRGSDIFALVIQVLVAFAKGEIDRTRKFFTLAMVELLKGQKKEYTYPFEDDILMMFAIIMPDLFLQEHGKLLISATDERALFTVLRNRAKNFRNRNRSVAKLVLARVDERLGGRKAKRLYDMALLAGKLNNNLIVQLFAYLWFGKHLLAQGKGERRDYLYKVQKDAARKNLQLIVSLAEKNMHELHIPYQSMKAVPRSQEEHPAIHQKMATLVHEHLKHVADVMHLDTALEGHLHESFTLLRRHCHYAQASCLLLLNETDALEVVYPIEEAPHARLIRQYVAPYLNLRSSLFLPVSDAPWYQRREGERPDKSITLDLHPVSTSESEQQDLDKTQVLPQVFDPELSRTKDFKDTRESTSKGGIGTTNNTLRKHQGDRRASDREAPGPRSFMNTLIPIRSGDQNIGIIMLEKMRLSGENSLAYRHDLDQFGAQLGLLVQKKTDIERIRKLPRAPVDYAVGQYHLEPVEWLSLWTHGRLRKERESTWYLGMNVGDSDYLLLYCRLNGAPEIRERLSPHIWYHMQALRALAVVGGRSHLTPLEMREELVSLLQKDQAFTQLEGISISFTFFNQENRVAVSGHFGPSRPLVLCAENEVTPFNEAILNLAGGRVLRYWEVRASMNNIHTYILPHDSSKLDSIPLDSLEKSLSTSINIRSASANLYRLLDKVLVKEHLPRYYVAAVIKEIFKENNDRLDLPKAQ